MKELKVTHHTRTLALVMYVCGGPGLGTRVELDNFHRDCQGFSIETVKGSIETVKIPLETMKGTVVKDSHRLSRFR
jgi:hypothetical protein